MKKFLLVFGLLSLFFTCFVTDASAKDMSRRFGIGVDSSISKFADDGRGISVVYAINKYFTLQLLLGVETYNADVKDQDDQKLDVSITEWNVSLRGIIPIVLSSDVNLSAVVGFTASGRASNGFFSADEQYSKYNDGYNFSIDLGVRPEWFITDHFSIHTQIGIGISIITEDGSAINPGLTSDGTALLTTKASGANVDFFRNADVFGMAGFTFWF